MAPGQMLAHYRIQERLGEGGMGVVYKALDTHLNRTVAIKVLPAEAMAKPERRKRFVQEAHAASALDHPNIVTIYDIAEADGQHFIVMQYVAGKTLRVLLARGALPAGDALRYAVQIADGLARAHGRGIVHRDLKPDNVMVNDEGQVKILDFGLAKLSEPEDAEASETLTHGPVGPRTEEGQILGTTAYMSPEQAQGKKLDARTDIFSFGSLLYEMVTGQQAFRGDNRVSVMAAIVRDEPAKASASAVALPLELEKLISRALRKDPDRRWQNMSDLRVALAEIKEESESGSAATIAVAAAARQPRRSPWVWAGALAAAAVLVGGAVWFRSGTSAPPAAAPRTVPLTSFSGRETSPSFSPDGNQVAFTWSGESDDNPDIYVKLIGAGSPLRLTTDPAADLYPAWSPDGRFIAFCRRWRTGDGIFLVPALGGSERKLSDVVGFSSLSWLPDGKALAIRDRGSPQEPTAIFILWVESGEKRKLTSPPRGFGDSDPAISPDGKTLAFFRARDNGGGDGDVELLSLTASGASQGEPKRLASERTIRGLAWTPDGRSLVFSVNRGGSQSLWRIPVSGGEPERVAVAGNDPRSPTLSLRGQRLAYSQSFDDTNIWRIAWPHAGDRAPSGNPGSPAKLIASTRLDVAPRYSPDGRRIAFVSDRAGSNREIWVCDSEGRSPVQLTAFGAAVVGSPRWSPDGRRIAFDSTKAGNSDIYVMSADGGAPRQLTTESSDDVRPSWSGDGRWIYFGSNRSGDWQVWKAPPEGGAAAQVTKNGGREAFESPDGKYVYYAKLDAPGIWRVPVEGGEETKVLEQGIQGYWAPVRDGIVVRTEAGPNPSLDFFSLTNRQQRRIAALPREARDARFIGLSVSPDEKWILYTQRDRVESDLVLVENFR
jgi:Tol biopolymer transport system component